MAVVAVRRMVERRLADDVTPPQHPRKAMRIFAQNWHDVVMAWRGGRKITNTKIDDLGAHEELGPLLEGRAELLMKWVDDDWSYGRLEIVDD